MKRTLFAALTLVSLAGCNYSFRAGSFPPPDVKTIAVQPFDNETDQFEIGGELYDQLLKNLPRFPPVFQVQLLGKVNDLDGRRHAAQTAADFYSVFLTQKSHLVSFPAAGNQPVIRCYPRL